MYNIVKPPELAGCYKCPKELRLLCFHATVTDLLQQNNGIKFALFRKILFFLKDDTNFSLLLSIGKKNSNTSDLKHSEFPSKLPIIDL